MTTIMMGKMEMELPDIYMINKFMGTCLKGPKAKSQLLLILKLGSASLEPSAWTRAAPPGLNPGGEGRSADCPDLELKSSCHLDLTRDILPPDLSPPDMVTSKAMEISCRSECHSILSVTAICQHSIVAFIRVRTAILT